LNLITRFLACLAILGLSSACAVAAPQPFEPELRDEIEQYLSDTKQEYGIAGYSIAILHNGETRYSGTAGYASIELAADVNDDTVFQVFSVSKLFTIVTLMQLVEAGLVDLDAPLAQYVHGLPDTWQEVTVRQAMSHSSGLPEFYNWPQKTPETAAEALEVAFAAPMEFERGTKTKYNQTNYLLLKQVIEHVTGNTLEDEVQARMIQAHGLAQTQYAGEFEVVHRRAVMYRSSKTGIKHNIFIDQPDYMFASTGLNSPARDLAIWFEKLLDHQLISEASLKAMWTPMQLTDGSTANFANGWEYSDYEGMIAFGHGGGNRADVRHFTKDGQSVTVIYLSNGSEREFWPGNVSWALADIVFAARGND
jgi:D-alanyl-D-alanine carboxypeptidase